MLNKSEKRAVALIVDHFGVDPLAIDRVVREVVEQRSRGKSVDLFHLVRVNGLLTDEQCGELQFGLESTRIDVSDAAPAPQPDPVLRRLRRLGDFRVLRLVGEGGMGAVFLAFDESKNRQIALKVLSAELARQQQNLDRFYREARTGEALSHPNIVGHLGSGQDPTTGLHYLVMEFIEGSTAHELLERHGRLKLGDAFHIILDIARALEYAHSRSVIHRDIKPGNILVGDTGLAKLSDFGLAKRMDEPSHLTQANQGFGTPHYMPYEQATNAKSADTRSDIFALGATLYHLLTGDVPFVGASSVEIVDKKAIGFFLPARAVVPDLPEVVDQILSRMMAREPDQRYQAASQILVDLDRTGLTSPVLSFVTPDKALEDPHIRQRLTAPAQPTLPDLRQSAPDKLKSEEIWVVRYRDANGQQMKAKLSRAEIVRRWKAKMLPSDAGVAATASGPFLRLRDVFLEAKPKKPSLLKRLMANDPRLWLILSLSLAGMTIVVILIVAWFVMSGR